MKTLHLRHQELRYLFLIEIRLVSLYWNIKFTKPGRFHVAYSSQFIAVLYQKIDLVVHFISRLLSTVLFMYIGLTDCFTL